MKLRYIYFSDNDKTSEVLEDYFSFTYPFKFSFSKTSLLKKHGSSLNTKTFTALERKIQKYGYAETLYERCESCSNRFIINSRDELEFLYKSPDSSCEKCRNKGRIDIELRYVYFSNKDINSGILEDYFSFTYPLKFNLNQTDLLKKYSNYLEVKTFKSLENKIQKIGYVETQYNRCDSCFKPFKIDSRNELEFLCKTPDSHCNICREKNSYADIIEAQDIYMTMTDSFFYIYNNSSSFPKTNKRKKTYNYPEINQRLQSLSFLSLIYLHEICDKLSFSTGRLKLKEFAIFSYAEDCKNNSYILELFFEGLLYTDIVTDNAEILYWRLLATKESPLKSPEHAEISQSIQKELYSPFPIVFIPQNYTLSEYKALIHSIISHYHLKKDDYIDIASYATSKRLGEIKFLTKVACYNNNLKLNVKNATNEKFKELSNKFNLQEINGYLASITSRTHYKLDSFSDDQRTRLKNVIFNNYLVGNKVTAPLYSKKLPNNYHKSLIVDFLASFVGMQDDSWLNLTINDFLKILFIKLKKEKNHLSN